MRRLAEQLEIKDDSDKRLTVENELAVLGRAARIAPYEKSESYLSYLDKVDTALHERAHNFTAYLDQVQQEDIREKGTEWVTTQKREHHNSAIEDLVMGAGGRNFYKEYSHRIYPAIGQIYVVPDNPYGRAPFYAYEKNLGGISISTYNFNLLIIGFFAFLAIIAIFAEFPGRFLREE